MKLEPPQIPGATLEEIERYAILTTYFANNRSTIATSRVLKVSVRLIQYRLAEWRMNGPAKPRESVSQMRASMRSGHVAQDDSAHVRQRYLHFFQLALQEKNATRGP